MVEPSWANLGGITLPNLPPLPVEEWAWRLWLQAAKAYAEAVRAEERERPTPVTDVEKRADSVIKDLADRVVPKPYREALGKALDAADKPLAGKAAGDAAIGRIGSRYTPRAADEPVWD